MHKQLSRVPAANQVRPKLLDRHGPVIDVLSLALDWRIRQIYIPSSRSTAFAVRDTE